MDDTRPPTNCKLCRDTLPFEADPRAIRLVATNSHMLAVHRVCYERVEREEGGGRNWADAEIRRRCGARPPGDTGE